MAIFCQQDLKLLGCYTRVFSALISISCFNTWDSHHLFSHLLYTSHPIFTQVPVPTHFRESKTLTIVTSHTHTPKLSFGNVDRRKAVKTLSLTGFLSIQAK